jgi:hypothetical protein
MKKQKNPIVAALLGFFFPGLCLFYISVKQGLYNLGVVFFVSAIMISTVLHSVYANMPNPNPNAISNYHSNPHLGMGSFFLVFILGFIISIGSAIWGYLAAKYYNEY